MPAPPRWNPSPAATANPWLRSSNSTPDNLRGNLAGAILLHGLAIAAVLAGSLLLRPHGDRWGEQASAAGAIQATVVSSLPLPPRQKTLDTGVLTSDRPSPAPTPAKERTEPPPRPHEVLIPTKPQLKPLPPPKLAEQPTPEPPKHPQTVKPQPTKATTGETSGIRIPQSTLQLKNGTASVSAEDHAFGARFAYYIRGVNTKVTENWYKQEADPALSEGKRATIVFEISRNGAVSDVAIEGPSGSPSLDTSAKRAVLRVDSFAPLPPEYTGDSIRVEFSFNYRQQ